MDVEAPDGLPAGIHRRSSMKSLFPTSSLVALMIASTLVAAILVDANVTAYSHFSLVRVRNH